jgi:hypothetical protein
MSLAKFLFSEKRHMLGALEWCVKDLKRTIKANPLEYIDYDGDVPVIDIRLCLDLGIPENRGGPSWTFRVGDSSFDPYHSEYCAGSFVGIDTDPEELLEELVSDVLDQAAERSA